MTRKEKTKIKRDSLKYSLKTTSYEPMTKKDRIVVLAISLTLIFGSLYVSLRNNSIANSELTKIYVTLEEAPKYIEYTVKSQTHRSITIRTKEYNREFKITGWNYEVTDSKAIQSNIFDGDRIELKVKTSEVEHLNSNSILNNYNDVYGLNKDGRDYIDLDKRINLMDNDGKWAYFFVILGLTMLPYVFIKGKPLINIEKAITAISLIVFVMLIIQSC